MEPEAPTRAEAKAGVEPEAPAQTGNQGRCPEAPTQLELAAPAQPEVRPQTEPARATRRESGGQPPPSPRLEIQRVVAEPQVETRVEPAARSDRPGGNGDAGEPKKPAKPRVRVRAKANPRQPEARPPGQAARTAQAPANPAPGKPE